MSSRSGFPRFRGGYIVSKSGLRFLFRGHLNEYSQCILNIINEHSMNILNGYCILKQWMNMITHKVSPKHPKMHCSDADSPNVSADVVIVVVQFCQSKTKDHCKCKLPCIFNTSKLSHCYWVKCLLCALSTGLTSSCWGLYWSFWDFNILWGSDEIAETGTLF